MFSCFARPDSFLALLRASVPFLWFAILDLFSAVPKAPCPVFIFSAPEHVLGDTEGVDPIFMFCPPGLVFGSTEGVGSRFYVLRSRTRFLRYRGRRVPFSCFARPESFSAVPRASGPVLMFCAPGLVFGGIEGVGYRFHVLRSRTRFRRCRRPQVSFSCFVLSGTFSEVRRASGPVFMFCAPGLSFAGGTHVALELRYVNVYGLSN
jgi:hypothetical protein